MGLAKLPAALRYIEAVLGDGVEKLAVFAFHRDVLLELHAALRSRFGAVLVLGGLSDKKRQEAVDAFQRDTSTRVFVGQLTAAGTGLTLTAANRLIRVEASWVPGENSQVEDRVARLGQEADSLLIEDLVVRGSLDAMILGSAARKSSSTGKVLQ
jgi:SWI/SNF-related matrix-associated actin-dependent regulator 1 of chromatin subfamily A